MTQTPSSVASVSDWLNAFQSATDSSDSSGADKKKPDSDNMCSLILKAISVWI